MERPGLPEWGTVKALKPMTIEEELVKRGIIDEEHKVLARGAFFSLHFASCTGFCSRSTGRDCSTKIFPLTKQPGSSGVISMPGT